MFYEKTLAVLCCAVPASKQDLKQADPARQWVAAIHLIIMTITNVYECLMTFDRENLLCCACSKAGPEPSGPCQAVGGGPLLHHHDHHHGEHPATVLGG